MAMPPVPPGKEGAFHQTGFIFKTEEFHGLSLPGADQFAGDEPAEETESFSPAHGGRRLIK